MLTDPHKHRWLMVTGTPRSGTTFLGDMLSQSVAVNTFIEPFNPHGGMPWVEQRYLHFPSASEMDAVTRRRMEDFFAYRFTQRTYIHHRDPFATRVRKRVFMGGNQFAVVRAKLNPLARFSLIKDPIAVFMIDVFLDMRPVDVFAMIRHPLSYVGSLKRLRWGFRLEPLLQQPVLRARYLFDFQDREPQRLTPLEASAWIWLAVNRYLLDVAARRSQVDLLFHEELSDKPVESIRACYARVGLRWDDRKEARVRALTEGTTAAAPRAGVVHDLERRSRDIFAQSAALLTDEERAMVLRITAPLSEVLYRDPALPDLSAEGQALAQRHHPGRLRAP